MHHRIARILLPVAALLPLAAFSATPPDGALTETSLELSYTTGPMPVPNVGANVAAGGAYDCSQTNPCDIFMLTVDLPEDYLETYPKATIKVVTAASIEYTDIDLQVADESGKNIALTRDNPPAQPSVSFKAKNGLNVYQIQIVPGTPVADASATVTLVPGKAAKSASGPFGGALGFALLLPLLGLALRRRR